MGKGIMQLLLGVWFIGMVFMVVQSPPVQGKRETGAIQQYFPTLLRNAPVLADPPLGNYMGLAVVGINDATELYTLRADGSSIQRLTNNSVQERAPQWSPTGAQIAYFESTEGNIYIPYKNQLMVMNRDGNNPTALGEMRISSHVSVLWSPNQSYLLANYSDNALVLLSVNGLEERVINDEGAAAPWEVGWSPNGRYFYYVYDSQVWIYTLATHTQQAVGALAHPYQYTPEEMSRIAWHPVTGELVFASADNTIQIVAPDGSGSRLLTEGDYLLGGWLHGGTELLLGAQPQGLIGVNLYSVPYGGGDITPIVISDDINYGVTFGGVSPQGDAVLYDYTYTGQGTVIHPLPGAPQPVVGAGCDTNLQQGRLCGIGRISWAYDGSAVMMGRSISDELGKYFIYTTNYITLDTDTPSVVRIPNLQQPTFLPFSTTKGIAYTTSIYPYPAPVYQSAYQIEVPEGTTTPIFHDLNNSVAIVEWRYLP